MYTVVFSDPADRDILQIVEYIAADNPEAAKRFGAKLLDLALSLSELPHRGSRVKKRLGQRKLILGDYLIYYRIAEKGRTVEILRFLHGAQIK
jgi:plasmid stabilization system protein ParE